MCILNNATATATAVTPDGCQPKQTDGYFVSYFSNHCCERGGVAGWHSRERVVSNLLAIKAGLPGPQRGPVLLVG